MNRNEYHILSFLPKYGDGELPQPLELLARRLQLSGRLRINADHAQNYVRHSGSGFDRSFSKRELLDPRLVERTRAVIADTVAPSQGQAGIDAVMDRLCAKLKHSEAITPERELQLARLLVQATHPAVMLLAMYEGANIYVSYSHNVADLMAVHLWDSEGLSGGLQMNSQDEVAIYISCGGDPFITKQDQRTYESDGFPALARLMVIAAQELAHYADIERDASGYAVGRHSVYFWPFMAREAVAKARRDDLAQVARLRQACDACGLVALQDAERRLRFYDRHRRVLAIWHRLRTARVRGRLLRHAMRQPLGFITEFPARLYHSDDLGENLSVCLSDMAFNLAPKADVYQRDDAQEEEAIACIEALARVPQQVVKWGHAATRHAWPNLYRIYYEQVIPQAIASFEQISGERYLQTLTPTDEKLVTKEKIKLLRLINK